MLNCKSFAGITTAIIVALPSAVLVPTDGWAQIEEIVVTTRRREENLQELPIAVTAINAEMIQRQNIVSMFDVAKLDPSVQMDTGFTQADTRITIRGLVNTRGRSNVAMLVDGVDTTTENQVASGSGMLANTRLLNDVERIEVVKGPQSARYGRAAFAGAISYTTKEPGDEFSSKVGVEVGQDGIFQLTGSFGGPVGGDGFGLLANGVYWSQDGFYDNSISGDDVGGGEGYGLALTGVYEPVDHFKLKLRVAYSDDEFDPRPQVKIHADSQEDLLLYSPNTLTFGNGAGGSIGGLGTGLRDFDLFCPQGPFERGGVPQPLGTFYNPATDRSLLSSPIDPATGERRPGHCVPQSYGDADGIAVTHSENPLTGEDYPGSTMELLRSTLTMNWDIGEAGKGGTLTSVTGYSDADTGDWIDQSFQARGRPDPSLSLWESHYEVNTKQFSQELRWASNFDGPIQFTAGALYWDESRKAGSSGYIIGCSPFGRNLTVNNRFQPVGTEDIVAVDNICDGGTNGGFGGGQPVVGPVLPIQQYFSQLAPFPVTTWTADTEHWSLYGMLEWQISNQWKLTLEDRYVNETFDISRPNQSSCAMLQFALGRLSFAPMRLENLNGTPGDGTYFDALCTAVNFDEPGDIDPNSATFNDYAIISGTEKSDFHTPKITFEWVPADNAMLYFSWAHAKKPGGITMTSGGNAAATIEDQRFLPEEMNAWEIGTKTNWRAAGDLLLNGAFFFQDYTDKQIGTQVLVEASPGEWVSQARVVNAAAAEVWGVEFEALWQPSFLEGLRISAAYTWLDPTYTDFIDETASAIRASTVGECPIVYTGRQGPNPDDKTDSANGDPACSLNLNGHQLERTPKNSFVTQFRLQRPLLNTGVDWFIEGNATWQDKRFESADNFTYWEDYWLTDIRFGFQADNWDVLAYVNNVFDDNKIKSGASAPDFGEQVTQLGFTAGFGASMWYGTLPDPRVWGVRANFRFGG